MNTIELYTYKQAEKCYTIKGEIVADCYRNYKHGLLAGIELAKEFAEWTNESYDQTLKDVWTGRDFKETGKYYSTNELFDIFLTQKEGK